MTEELAIVSTENHRISSFVEVSSIAADLKKGLGYFAPMSVVDAIFNNLQKPWI